MTYLKGPSENTLTVNTTHQMLRYYEDNHATGSSHLVVFSPSRRWENLRGYDVQMSFLKTTVFQYKRPKIPESSRMSHEYRRFSLSRDQWLTLILLFERGQAFFTLPEVMEERQLEDSMNRTIFLDVYGVLPNTSLAFVPPHASRGGSVNDFLLGKIRNGPKYPINPKHVYSWRDISNGVDQCTVGLPILYEEERSDAFTQFESRIGQVDDFAEVDWWRSRLNQILDEQLESYIGFYSAVNEARSEFPPEEIFGINPLGSETWEEVSSLIPPNGEEDQFHEDLDRVLKRDWTMGQIQSRINRIREQKSDPTTYRIKNSQVNLFGK